MGSSEKAVLRLGPGNLEVPLELFRQNRERLSGALRGNPRTPPNSVVLLQGGDDIPFYDTDTAYVFRQESYFMWSFGVLEPGCYGTVNVTTGAATLYVPRLPADYAVWMGPLLQPADYQRKYQVDRVLYVDQLNDDLTSQSGIVLLLMQGVNTDSGLEVKPAYFKGIEQFKRNTEVLFPTISELRVTKTPLELDVLRYVARLSSDAHKLVMRYIRPGRCEFQGEALFLHHCYGEGGARHVSYTCICGSGPNSAILHYGHAAAPNDRLLKDGDMCLFDMGANYVGYAADITCSFPANGKFTADQRMIYEAVLAARNAVISAIRPGVSWVDMHKLAARTMLTSLVQGGLLQGSIDAMMSSNLYAVFQPHGLGHLLGLDVHDVGGYPPGGPSRPSEPGLKALRMARELKAGMVLTVEPGCYFIDMLLDGALKDPVQSGFIVKEVLDRFRGFGGVRIEDDCIVTENGVENMTFVPRTVDEIEAWMAGKDYE